MPCILLLPVFPIAVVRTHKTGTRDFITASVHSATHVHAGVHIYVLGFVCMCVCFCIFGTVYVVIELKIAWKVLFPSSVARHFQYIACTMHILAVSRCVLNWASPYEEGDVYI